MKQPEKIALFALYLALGWLFLYAGVTKIIDPSWSAAGYLANAKTFPGLYSFFASPDILPVINFINKWGLALLGLSLITGVWVRTSSILGAILMLLYYFPILDFPYAGKHAFLIDEHIIYILILIMFAIVPRREYTLAKLMKDKNFGSKDK